MVDRAFSCFTAVVLCFATLVRAQTFVWEPVLTGATTPGVTTPGVAQLGADPVNPDGAWACFGNRPNPAAVLGETVLPTAGGCWRTDDWGGTWNRLSSDDPVLCPIDGSQTDFDTLCQQDNVLELAICSPQVLAVGVHEKGFFLSTDAGVTWSNISDGITHDDTGAGHFDDGGSLCLPHDVQDFRERRSAGFPWAGLALDFDPSDSTCNTIWVGVGDTGSDLFTGVGDHPGVYVTTDAGATWEERNGGDYDAERADPFACHPLNLISHTSAPADLAISRTGFVYLTVADTDWDLTLFGIKTACSRPRIFQLDDTSDATWIEQNSPVLDHNERCIDTSGFGLGVLSSTFGQLTESASGLDYIALQMQNVSITADWGLDPVEWKSQSQGILAGIVGDPICWLEWGHGLPAITDDFNTDAQNVSPISISPSNFWLAGTRDQDGSPPDGGDDSFVFAGPNFGATFINLVDLTPDGVNDMRTAPNDPLLTESGIASAIWSSDGLRVMVHTQWYDHYDPLSAVAPGKPVELDDGLYIACPFSPGGDCGSAFSSQSISPVDSSIRSASDEPLRLPFSGGCSLALGLTISDEPDPVRLGESLEYDFTVTGDAAETVRDVVLTATLPQGATLDPASLPTECEEEELGTVVCHLGDLPSDTSELVEIAVFPTESGTNQLSANVDGADGAFASGAEETTVTAEADLILTMEATEVVRVGQEFDYLVQVTNGGPHAARDVVITDVMPAGVRFLRSLPAVCNDDKVPGVVECELPEELDKDESFSVTLSVRAIPLDG